jgi:hypothetical protein
VQTAALSCSKAALVAASRRDARPCPVVGTLHNPFREGAPLHGFGRHSVTRKLDSHLVHGCFSLATDHMTLFADDRHRVEAVEQPLREPVDLRRSRGSTCENAKVDSHVYLRSIVSICDESEARILHRHHARMFPHSEVPRRVES